MKKTPIKILIAVILAYTAHATASRQKVCWLEKLENAIKPHTQLPGSAIKLIIDYIPLSILVVDKTNKVGPHDLHSITVQATIPIIELKFICAALLKKPTRSFCVVLDEKNPADDSLEKNPLVSLASKMYSSLFVFAIPMAPPKAIKQLYCTACFYSHLFLEKNRCGRKKLNHDLNLHPHTFLPSK